MARIGYARVSTTDQDLDIQNERLKAAGCEIIRSETGRFEELHLLSALPVFRASWAD